MHEFTTDVVRRRILPGPGAQALVSSPKLVERLATTAGNAHKQAWYMDGFWQTLAEALLIASSRWLDVDDTANAEVGITFRKETNEPCLDGRELVLYDTAPGGAGYAAEIVAHLNEVFRIAARVLGGCTCGDSCYQCLRSYRNQWAHAKLDRHLVAEGLESFLKLNWPEYMSTAA